MRKLGAVALAAAALFSASVYAEKVKQNSWYLPLIEDISIKIDVDAAMRQTGDSIADQRLALELASEFEAQGIKEDSGSGNVYKVEFVVETMTPESCRYTVKTSLTRPTVFRGKPKIDWTDQSFIRQPCDYASLSRPIEELRQQLRSLFRARATEVANQQQGGEELGQQLGELVVCAAGGACASQSSKSNSGGWYSDDSGSETDDLLASDPAKSSRQHFRDVCNCKGNSGPGGPCFDGPGGPAYDGPGGPAYSGPGGPCYAGPGGPQYDGPGGPNYSGPGGPKYDGPGGPAYDGPGGPAYSGPGGPCYDGPGGPCYSGPGGRGENCPSICK